MKGRRWILCTASAGLVCLAGGLARAAAPHYVLFFADAFGNFNAYYDADNVTTDGSGYKLVHFKLAGFSESERPVIEQICPGAGNAEYALGSYTIDCSQKTVGDHRVVWYDSEEKPLVKCDFSGPMADAKGAVKQQLIEKICGF